MSKALIGILVGGGLLAIANSSSASRPLPNSPPKPVPKPFDYKPPSGNWLNGIDTNYDVNWSVAKEDASLSFAIRKASQGAPGYPNGFQDSGFLKNRDKMIAELPYWGAYHYAILNQPARLQAQSFMKTLGNKLDRMLPPSLDLEWQFNDGKVWYGTFFPQANGKQVIDFLYEWVDEIHKGIGRKCMAYTSAGWWNSIGDPVDPIQNAIALWVASWTSASKPSMPKGWTSYDLWQFSAEQGPLAGVTIKGAPAGAKSIDRNRFPGTLADMEAFIKASIV